MLTDLDRKLKGLPDKSLTLALLIAGLVAILVAIYGTPTLKAALLIWMIAP